MYPGTENKDIWLRSGRVIFREPEVSAFRAWDELTDSSLFKLFLGSSVSLFSVWAMAVLKGVISLYRAGKEKPIERYKARIDHFRIALCLLPAFKKNLIDFLGLLND